jgi:hypothetical protein
MKKFINILLISACLFIFGCGQQTTAVDGNGYQYKLISPQKSDGNVSTVIWEGYQLKISGTNSADEVWQRVNPLDTNEFYMPSWDWKVYPNHKPSFDPIVK